MKKSCFLAVLMGAALCVGVMAQAADTYHLVVVDRAGCPGQTAAIDTPLFTFAHGRTGYHIIFGRGAVTLPRGARAVVNRTANSASGIAGYLDQASFRRYVSSTKILEGLKFAVNEEDLAVRKSAASAAQGAAGVYHLVVIDRAGCPGETVGITEPLATFAHGRTGYYIVFGRGTVSLPRGAVTAVEMSSARPSALAGYLDEPAFQRYVSSTKVLEGFRFAMNTADR